MIYKRILAVLTISLTLFNVTVFAQKGVEDGSKYGKGEDSIRALQNLSMYQQYIKQRAYKEAVIPWRVIFIEAPRCSYNMYLHGVTIYKTLFNETQDPELRKAYVDTIMLIYDQRSQYFGKRGEVLARKALDMRKLDETRSEEAYNFIVEAIKLDGNDVPDFAINTFMQISLSRYLKEEIDRDQMINNFATSVDIMEHKIKHSKDEKERETNQQILNNANLIFSNSGAADCETLTPVLERKYTSNPDDIGNLSTIVNLLRTVGCEDTELFAKAAEKLYELEPSASSAYNLGKFFLAKKEFNKTISYYEQAINLEESDVTKAQYYSELALIYFVAEKSPSETRNIANKALQINPNDGKTIMLIGRLYVQYNRSISEVEFEQNTAYWAAVDKFIQAKRVDPTVTEEADKLIYTYSAYFPTLENAFFHDLSEGQEYVVPGWINERTRVRLRK
jgi:tetratricopeptide (TPR) repeat protein